MDRPITDDDLERVRRRLRAVGLYARAPGDPGTRAAWRLYGAADGAPNPTTPSAVLTSNPQTHNAALAGAALVLRTDRETTPRV